MTWANRSRRRTELPPNWPELRRQVLERDGHRCRWIEGGQRCGAPATDVDHIRPGNDHRLTNLRSLCTPHHRRKTSAEGHAARGQGPTRHRPPEQHPGRR